MERKGNGSKRGKEMVVNDEYNLYVSNLNMKEYMTSKYKIGNFVLLI